MSMVTDLINEAIEDRRADAATPANRRCPSDSVHRFPAEFSIGDVCDCSTWQIETIRTRNFIVCVDVAGNRQEFDRE